MTLETSASVANLLHEIPSWCALCAINVENHDSLTPTLRAAAQVGCPVIVAMSVPVALYLGLEYSVELVRVTAARFGTRYALHLDHCEDPSILYDACQAGFNSANFLDEGETGAHRYADVARRLRSRIGD